MTDRRCLTLLLLTAVSASAQDPEPGAAGRPSANLVSALEALGASNGVPDGAGSTQYAKQPVRGQQASLGMFTAQAGGAVPAWESGNDQLFVTGAGRWLSVPTKAVLPDDRAAFPNNWYDVQAGGLFVRQTPDGRSWGVGLTGGSVSDRPFQSVREAAVNAIAFLRVPSGDDAWLFYVVSATNGQVGQNIPIPGVAYEFRTENWRGVAGFPFVNVTRRLTPEWDWEFSYAALTDVQTRVNWHATAAAKLYGGFAWTNQSWFRAGRADRNDQFFYYEKRLEAGVVYTPANGVNLEVAGGEAFDRYFFETHSFSLTGRNRVDAGAGPFVRCQLELKY